MPAQNVPAEDTAITRFASVLFLPDEGLPPHRTSTDALHDLALDQVIHALTAREPTGALAEVFQTPLATVDAIVYRQEVFRDLDDPDTRATISRFLDELRQVDHVRTRAANSHYRYQVDRWHLNAVCAYADAVETLRDQLPGVLDGGGQLTRTAGTAGSHSSVPGFRCVCDAAGSGTPASRQRGCR